MREFDKALLKSSRDALFCAAKQLDGDVIGTMRAEKRGSGGWSGSTQWKKKDLVFYDKVLVYIDRSTKKMTPVQLQDSSSKRLATDCVILVSDREYLFRLQDDGGVDRFFKLYRQSNSSS